jgi:hypothetical protein
LRAKHLLEIGVHYDPEARLVATFNKGDGQSSDHYEKWSIDLALFGLFISVSRVEEDSAKAVMPDTVWGLSYFKSDGDKGLARFWGWRDE